MQKIVTSKKGKTLAKSFYGLLLIHTFSGPLKLFVQVFSQQLLLANNSRCTTRHHNTVGAKKYIQLPAKSKRLQLLISLVQDELEKRRFWHLTQNGQEFFDLNIKFQQLLVCLLRVPKVATFLRLVFLAKKFRHVATTELKQLCIENLLRTR